MAINQSLKRRLTASVIAIFILSWLVSVGVTTVAARLVLLNEMDRILGGVLLVTESIGRPFVAGELTPLQSRFSDNMESLEPGRGIQDGTLENPVLVRLNESLLTSPLGTPSINVWVGGIHLLVGEGTPAFPAPDSVEMGVAFTHLVDGEKWRVMYRQDPENPIWYAVGMARRQAQFDGSQLLLQMLLPLALIIPLTVLALYFGIARGLRPLRTLATEIGQRQRAKSLQALQLNDVPEELSPVVESLNDLLLRLASTLENEQRFTANAAHELQTPLAAITTEVQLCQRLLQDGPGHEMMERINARVRRASHSVSQLLILARLDPQDDLPREALELHALSQEVVSDLGHLASARDLQIQLDIDAGQRLLANREAMLILLRNLVSNAFRYAAHGGVVSIRAQAEGLLIENDSELVENPQRLVDRFYRGESPSGQSREPGTGLGLSIVKRISELHDYSLLLSYSKATARFRVELSFI
jgi:signal transduction histidine kinase